MGKEPQMKNLVLFVVGILISIGGNLYSQSEMQNQKRGIGGGANAKTWKMIIDEDREPFVKHDDFPNASRQVNRHSQQRTSLLGANTGSAYLKGRPFSRVRVLDSNPINPSANPTAYRLAGDSITIEAWIFPLRLPAHNSGMIIVGRPANNGIRINPFFTYVVQINNYGPTDAPRIAFELTDGTTPIASPHIYLADPNPPVVGSWTHIAATYDQTTAKLYINGILVAQTTYTLNIGAGSIGFYIGGVTYDFFHGLIDEMRLWGVARTASEIQTFKDTTLTGNEYGLAGNWPLDEAVNVNGVYPATVDLTSNHNDLVVQFGAEFVNFPAGSTVSLPPGFIIESLYGVVGQQFLYRPNASGWPSPAISLVSGPSGMSVNSGIVEWIPSAGQVGYHNFTLQATNTAGTVQGTYTIWADPLPLQIKQHTTSNIQFSVLNNGAFGANLGADTVEGDVGFRFNGLDGLFEGDLVIARSQIQVSGGLFIREFGIQDSIVPISSSLPGFDQAFETRYNDQRASNPIGVGIVQQSHSKSTSPDAGYVIMEYEISNNSGTTLNGIYVGLTTDWDVSIFSDLGGYDAQRKLSYAYGGTVNTNYYGITPLTGNISGHAHWTAPGGDSGDSVLYYRMTTSSDPPTTPGDVRAIIATGPYILQPGQRQLVAFAIIGGTNLANLQQNADAAKRKWNEPFLLSVRDVPFDQGERVTLSWNASSLDTDVSLLTYYSVWRALPGTLHPNGKIVSPEQVTREFTGPGFRIETSGSQTYFWEWIANQPAHRFPSYSYTALTLYDSMAGTDGKHYFLISAHTNDPNVFYDSNVDSGHSVDNLPPFPPQNLVGNVVAGNVVLHWNPNNEGDLEGYEVYRSVAANFDPDTMTVYATTSDTLFTDTSGLQGNSYYALRAVDIHGNRGSKSSEVAIVFVGVEEADRIPNTFALYQNYPNPFNPSTIFKFDVAAPGLVSLKIYDYLGQVVAVLVNENLSAGRYQFEWNAKDIASGVYFYRLLAVDFVETKKLVLLK